MPFSSSSGKAWSVRIIKRLISKSANKSILDAGAGSGNYCRLLRPELPAVEFCGVEIWEPYIARYSLKELYDCVINADIRSFIPQKTYGVTILGDVLEHMSKADAIGVYNKLLDSSEFIFISIPVVNYPQDEYMGNPYEKHVKDDWSHEEVLASFKHISLSYIENEIGTYVGYNPGLHPPSDLADADKPSFAVYGIYKNEASFIERFLNSVKAADEIVLCDTGSDDDTGRLISDFKEKHPEVNLKAFKISVSPWRFDDARNTALALVGDDIDVCISLDMDEYLMDGWRAVLSSKWDFKFTRYYHKFRGLLPGGKQTAHWHERIHARRGYTWKLPVHEILEYSGAEKICWMDDFWVFHEPDGSKSRTSYLPLLEQSACERPGVWKTWAFLASEYLAAVRHEDASAAIDRAMALEDSDRGYLHKLKYHLYKGLNKPDLALLSLNNSILYLSGRREPYVEKARYLHELGRDLEAYFTLADARQHTDMPIDYHYDATCWGEQFEAFMSEVRNLAGKDGLSI